MNTPDHTPACAESPHFCICSPSTTLRNYNDEPIITNMDAGPGGRAGVITIDQLSMDNIAASPEADLFKQDADGGWGLRQHNLTLSDLPEITVARGGIKYPSAAERLAKVRAELNTALENARFWRRQAIALGALALAWLVVGVSFAMGWV